MAMALKRRNRGDAPLARNGCRRRSGRAARGAGVPALAMFFAVTLGLAGLLGGCASLPTGFETPAVSVSSFRALPGEGVSPRFRIALRIVNPNRTALRLQGVAYSVSLEGHKVLTGVANDLPVIDAYGEAEVVVIAAADLLSSVRLIADLMGQQRSTFNYQFAAKLDMGALLPPIRVLDQGQVSLGATRSGAN